MLQVINQRFQYKFVPRIVEVLQIVFNGCIYQVVKFGATIFNGRFPNGIYLILTLLKIVLIFQYNTMHAYLPPFCIYNWSFLRKYIKIMFVKHGFK